MATPVFEQLQGLEKYYDQIQKMAIGGMAEIFRGRQISLDRAVAIKRVRPEIKSNAEILARFRREAKVSAALLHQNLAHVYDFRESDGEAYIIMEYIDGYDLSEVLEKTGPLPLDVAAMISLKVLAGLSHVHAHGMVHRDLKPDNVRLSTRGEVKIMDFGIAFDPVESNLTMPGVLIGSPHYLAPEQILGEKLDGRADLFAFGITFYEIVTGKRPFYEKQKETVYTRIQKGVYQPAKELRPDVPPYLLQIIDSCLQTDVHKRAASANRLAVGLQDYISRNYSLSHDARIKQFLMQSKMLHGRPELIEIEERTLGSNVESESSTSGLGSKTKKKLLVAFVLLIFILLGAFFKPQYFGPLGELLSPPDFEGAVKEKR